MTHQESGLITILAERLKTVDEQHQAATAATACDRDMKVARGWRDEREEGPVQPIQDRPERERWPVEEPSSDDDERHDPPPLRT
jgi:hypothetical protein